MNHAMDATATTCGDSKRFADEDEQQGFNYLAAEDMPDDVDTRYDTDPRLSGLTSGWRPPV